MNVKPLCRCHSWPTSTCAERARIAAGFIPTSRKTKDVATTELRGPVSNRYER